MSEREMRGLVLLRDGLLMLGLTRAAAALESGSDEDVDRELERAAGALRERLSDDPTRVAA